MAPKLRNPANREPTWITDSCNFVSNIISDTMKDLNDDSLVKLTRTERKMLVKLEAVWLNKYNGNERLPEAQSLVIAKKPPRKRRAAVLNPAAAKKRAARDKQIPDDPSSVTDDDNVIYRLNVSRLRPHWRFRVFDLKMTGLQYKQKNELLLPLINWNSLEEIMLLPEEEGTALLQQRFDEMVAVTAAQQEQEDEDGD